MKIRPSNRGFTRKLKVDEDRPIEAADVWEMIETGTINKCNPSRTFDTSEIRDKLLFKQNKGEAIAIQLMDAAGLSYRREVEFHYDDRLFFMDFLVNIDGRRIALEVDGNIHRQRAIRARDIIKNEAYVAHDWIKGVLRIKVKQINKISPQQLVDLLLATKPGEVTYCDMDGMTPEGRKGRRKRDRRNNKTTALELKVIGIRWPYKGSDAQETLRLEQKRRRVVVG